MSRKEQVVRFHSLYYGSRVWQNTFWMGVPAYKCPLDLWIYQEVIFEVKPDVIVECGTADGGSALFLAHMCELANRGRIVTIDVGQGEGRPRHPRITYVLGSSTAGEVVQRVRRLVTGGGSVMVILDSDHSKAHVLDELRIYSTLVTKGSYLIVEDTNVNGHPVLPDFGPGPMEAVEEFLKENSRFVIDDTREKFYMTFNPRGYLRRLE